VAFGAAADTPLQGLALEAVQLTLGEPMRNGDWSRQDVYEQAPDGFYLTGVAAAAGSGRLTHT
jgi:hypothetical protein